MEFVAANRNIVLAVGALGVTLTAAGGGLFAFGVIATFAGRGLIALGSAVQVVYAALAFLTGPVGLTIAAIASLAWAFVTFTDIGRKAARAVSEVFNKVLGDVRSVFAAIADAIATGNISLALQIMASYFRTIWNTILIMAEDTFGNFISLIVETFNSVKNAVVAVWDGLVSFLSQAWNTFSAFVGDVFSGLMGFLFGDMDQLGSKWKSTTDGMFSSWGGFVKGVQKMWVEAGTWILNMINDIFEALEWITNDLMGLGREQEILATYKSMDKMTEEGRQDRINAIEQKYQQEAMAYADASAARRGKAEEALKAAQGQLDEAMKAAADAKAKKIEGIKKLEDQVIRPPDFINNDPKGDGSPQASRAQGALSVAGTFSAYAAGRIAMGTQLTPFERESLKEQKATRGDIKKLVTDQHRAAEALERLSIA